MESYALYACLSLKSILLPRSVKELSENWAFRRALCQIAFESALSLGNMIVTGKADLRKGFEITLKESQLSMI
jgi:hypothetical protein